MAECTSSYKHPLKHAWSLWYYKNDKSKDWSSNLKEVYNFDTVEDFWSMFNHIKSPSELIVGCDYYLFKKGIKPEWEDPANKNGGRWLITVEKRNFAGNRINDFWMDIILMIIGENLTDNNEEVCGVVLNVRPKQDKIAVWTADSSEAKKESIISIGKMIRKWLHIPQNNNIYFQTHKDEAEKIPLNKSTYIM